MVQWTHASAQSDRTPKEILFAYMRYVRASLVE